MELVLSEETYFENWYDWETVYENLQLDLSPEVMVAINNGFGISKGIPNMTGEMAWNEEKLQFEIGNLRIRRSKKVDFYKEAALFEITDLNDAIGKSKKVIMSNTKIKHLYLNEDIYQLDNSNGPIYEANEKFGLNLNEASAINYIYFFFLNVKGRHGRFYPVSSFNDIQPIVNISMGDIFFKEYSFNRMESDATDLQLMSYSIKPFFLQGMDHESANHLDSNNLPHSIVANESIVIFKDSIFSSTVTINIENGFISLSNEKLLYEGFTNNSEQQEA